MGSVRYRLPVFGLIAATRPRIRVAQIAAIPSIVKRRKNPQGFFDSALPQSNPPETFRFITVIRGNFSQCAAASL